MNGPRRGEVIIAPLPPPDRSAIASFVAQFRGKLKGKFLLAQSTERSIPRENRPMVHRYTDAEMQEFESAPTALPKPAPSARPTPTPPAQNPPRFEETMAAFADLHKFLEQEQVLGIVGAARGEGGTLFVRPPAAPPIVPIEPPPTFDLAAEHYNRIIRRSAQSPDTPKIVFVRCFIARSNGCFVFSAPMEDPEERNNDTLSLRGESSGVVQRREAR
jgi:hypothetical protein